MMDDKLNFRCLSLVPKKLHQTQQRINHTHHQRWVSKKGLQTLAKLVCMVICVVGATVVDASEDQPYLKQGRVDYIAAAIEAFNQTPLQSLHNTESYIYAVDRNNCQSALPSLRLECMLNYARENCQSLRGQEARQYCQQYSDIIIVNKLSETNFIDKGERYRIAKNAEDGDVRSAMMMRLQQKYARIVTQYALSEKSDCDKSDMRCQADGMDEFCLDYTNRESLSWQYCIGAVVWFIGTSPKPSPQPVPKPASLSGRPFSSSSSN